MPRATWSGTVSFGLVSVPIRVYSAIEQKDVAFHMVDAKTKSRIRYKRVAEKSGREVGDERIVKGYELGKGEYVLLEPDELADLNPKATRTIDIEDFVALDEIDPIYFEHTYFLAPGAGGERAYALLQKAMEKTGKIAIGRVVMRNKQYLAAIRPFGRALAMETMLFPDEVRDVEDLSDLPDRRARVNDKELKVAEQLIGSLTTSWKPERYEDTYRKQVLAYIRKKAKGQTVEVEEHAGETTAVKDLMEVLRASVESTRPARRKAS
jgi:DNA end-binding protein Ku